MVGFLSTHASYRNLNLPMAVGSSRTNWFWSSRAFRLPIDSPDVSNRSVDSLSMFLLQRISVTDFCRRATAVETVGNHCLVGGLEHFLFSHILGIIIPIDFHIFQRGSNHQPAAVDPQKSPGNLRASLRRDVGRLGRSDDDPGDNAKRTWRGDRRF